MQAFGVAAGEAKGATAFMLAAELVSGGRIVTGCGPVTHSGQFRPGEKLQLPHGIIVPQDRSVPSVLDHARFKAAKERLRSVVGVVKGA